MVEPSDDSSSTSFSRLYVRIVHACRNLLRAGDHSRHSLKDVPTRSSRDATASTRSPSIPIALHETSQSPYPAAGHDVVEKAVSALPPPAPPPVEDVQGETSSAMKLEEKSNKIFLRFYATSKQILLSSWINVLLVFVPVGIAIHIAGFSPTIVFAMNAIAIIPLAGLLSHATESVASELGDTIGALLNVTFGNAVELIILWVCHQRLTDVTDSNCSMYVNLTKGGRKRARGSLLGTCNSIAFSLIRLLQFPVISSSMHHMLTALALRMAALH